MSVAAADREVKTTEQAVALIDEWVAAYRELERQVIVLDRAWSLRYRELEAEHHRAFAQLCDYVAAEAAADLANQEASGCPF